MAENAAHLSSAPQKNPSIFEVIAQESLMSSLQASTKILCDILSKKDHRYRWLSKWHEEIYLCFNCFLQYHYLKKFGGSFSEAFYNLRRAPIKDPSKVNLTIKESIKSLLVLVALPYAADKLKEIIDNYESRKGNIDLKNDGKLIDTFIQYYRYFCLSYESIKLIQFIRYMMGKSSTHTPLLDLAGVRLVYQTDDAKKFPDFSWKDVLLSPFRRNNEGCPDIKSVMVKVFCQGLEFSAFFIQFLRWWQSDENRAKISRYPVPSAPHSNTENSLRYNGLCPICMRKRRVEVVLQTSGYVFCYRCISEQLHKTGKCPVTGLPSSKKDLIRVYDAIM